MSSKPTPRADKTLTFASEYVSDIHLGTKTATVRYNDEKDISEGDLLKCKKPNGRPFARVKVTDVEIAAVRKVPDLIKRMGENHGADDWQELKAAMNTYYDDQVYATTDVKVIVFEVVEQHE